VDALDALFPLALVALGLVAVVALRHPILASVAFRNSLRRKRQSVLVVFGLLVGTAIVSGALVAGDSMEYAIVEATYDAFQEIDELVFLDGYAFFPQSVAASLAQDPALRAATDGVGANVLWNSAVSDLDTGQYEPTIRLVGFDPHEEPVWGAFRAGGSSFTGATLAPDEVVLHRDAADRLHARVGDRLVLNFTRPLDPVLPRIEQFDAATTVAPGPLPIDPGVARPYVRNFTLDRTTVHLTFGVRPVDPPAGQDVDVELTSPGGRVYSNANGTIGAPDAPVLNVTGSVAQPLETGTWRMTVTAKAPAPTNFNATLLRLEPFYDLAAFQARLGELQHQFPGFDAGDVEAFAGRETRTVHVAFIADGGKGPNFKLPTALNLFLRLDTLQDYLGRPGEVNLVKVSNPGGVVEGGDRSDDVFPLLYARLNATKDAAPGHAAIQALKADKDKSFWLAQARQIGQVFSIFLTFIGSFSVIAGLMLIVNIFTMLAEERKAELGISRAVGLRRGHLTRLFTLEGALYALPAAALGTVAGLGLARALIWGFNFFGDPEVFPPIPYRLDPASLLLAFATGFLLTLATIYVAARRVARLNVVSAIRNLEEPEMVRGRLSLWGGALLASLGAALTAYAFLADSFAWQVLAPGALALGLAWLLRRHHPRGLVYPPIAIALFAYLTLTLFLIKRYDSVEGNVFGPIRAVFMALSIVVVVVYTEIPTRPLGRLFLRWRRLQSVALPATSYPLHKKFRAFLTLAMFAVTLLVVSLFSIFGHLFQPDPEKEAGGYDVEAYTQVPIERLEDHGTDRSVLARIDHYDTLPYYLRVGGTLVRVDGETTGQFGPPQDYVYGIDAGFADHNRFGLLRRDPAYATDAEAFRAVAASDDLAIAAYSYSTDAQGNEDRHGVGSTVDVEAKGGAKRFQLVGVMEQVHYKGVFVSEPALRTMFTDLDTVALIDLRPGEDAEAGARDLEAAYRDVGMDASSIRGKVLEESQQFRQIFTLIQLFLSLGLIVGILSLGIVTARSVIERRQEIGMMRALGYRRSDIRRTFLLETLTTVALGVLVGAALAVLVSFGLWFAVVRKLNIGYEVPWLDLAIIAAISVVATTLATLSPIVRASRIPPAEALRYIE
jgi:putative ABC transport system permease protein